MSFLCWQPVCTQKHCLCCLIWSLRQSWEADSVTAPSFAEFQGPVFIFFFKICFSNIINSKCVLTCVSWAMTSHLPGLPKGAKWEKSQLRTNACGPKDLSARFTELHCVEKSYKLLDSISAWEYVLILNDSSTALFVFWIFWRHGGHKL